MSTTKDDTSDVAASRSERDYMHNGIKSMNTAIYVSIFYGLRSNATALYRRAT